MCWKAKYILLIGFSILVTYLAALLMAFFEKKGKNKLRGWVLAGAILSNLAVLFLFKYYNFFVENLAALSQNRLLLPLLNYALPVGISFYTFQTLGYAIDVYRKDIAAEKNLITYALFISFYPQLVAGPIERSTNLMPQIKQGTHFSFENMRAGLLLMGWGDVPKAGDCRSARALCRHGLSGLCADGRRLPDPCNHPLCAADLLRFRLLLQHRAGRGTGDGIPTDGQLQRALFLEELRGVLVEMAYLAEHLVSGLYLWAGGLADEE